MKKNLNAILLVFFIIVVIIFLLLKNSNYKELILSKQIAEATVISDCDYSIMGKSYTDKIYEKFDVVKFGKQSESVIEVFKKPIDWIVLEKKGNAALLISKYIIDCKAFDYVDIESLDRISDEDKTDFKNCDWKKSSLRDWLNNDFLNLSFSMMEKGKILETHLQDTDTMDKIFCLNEKEYKKYFDNGQYYERDRDIGDTHLYYNGATARNKKAQSYDKYNLFKSDETYVYWLRDKTTNSKEHGVEFGSTKTIGSYGEINSLININMYCGVRPAMWVTLD